MKTIAIPKYGVSTLVDDIDYRFVLTFTLLLSGSQLKDRCYVYAYKPGMEDGYPLHRLIAARAGIDTSGDIDHRNQNKLDNQRHNLRPATRTQNFANRGKYRNNKSGFKNVFWSKQKQRWQGKVAKDRKQHHAGFYDTPEEAYDACQRKAAELFGQFASA